MLKRGCVSGILLFTILVFFLFFVKSWRFRELSFFFFEVAIFVTLCFSFIIYIHSDLLFRS